MNIMNEIFEAAQADFDLANPDLRKLAGKLSPGKRSALWYKLHRAAEALDFMDNQDDIIECDQCGAFHDTREGGTFDDNGNYCSYDCREVL